MAMKKGAAPALDPAAYLAGLSGWQKATATALWDAVQAAGLAEARIKWGHIVGFSNGPVLLIRAEESRVLFGFWRGKRLREIEPRLKPSGKYELANVVYTEGDAIDAQTAGRLAREAVRLNAELGDPTKLA